MLITVSMPSGVEHYFVALDGYKTSLLITVSMPSGVEHFATLVADPPWQF